MRISIKLYGNLRNMASMSKTELFLEDSSTVADALNAIAELGGGELRKQIIDENGTPHKYIIVVLNGKQIAVQNTNSETLNDGDILDLLPPARGG
ncbi:MAG: MoaD/ThiS family protein [Candidatus Bathyarchaeia archaeon]|jgi:MoaD family protein